MKTLLKVLSLFSLTGVCAQNWQSVSSGLDDIVRVILPRDTTSLIVGGDFLNVNNIPQRSIASWNGTGFDSIQELNCMPLLSLGNYDGNVCATNCGNIFSNQNGSWSQIGQGFNGTAFCYLQTDSLLYVGGGFNSLNGQPCSGLSMWNGLVWKNISLPYFGGSVSDIALLNGTLYVVGQFPDSTGDTFTKILKKNCGCGGWTDITDCIKGDLAWAGSLAVYKGELYVGGKFKKSDGSIGNSIARYDGVIWRDVDNGLAYQNLLGQVYSMHVWNDLLYVGGYFQYAGGIQASNIATWDGQVWRSLGGVFNKSILSITDWRNELYVGGAFTKIDGVDVKYLARHN